jgi:hypothetical protein
MLKTDETNSICSDDDTKESVIIKEKDDEEEEDDDEEDDDDEEEADEDDDDDDDDDDEEFDATIIQFEMLKNFFVDKEGNNIATHLNSISHELRKLNKIAVKLLEK